MNRSWKPSYDGSKYYCACKFWDSDVTIYSRWRHLVLLMCQPGEDCLLKKEFIVSLVTNLNNKNNVSVNSDVSAIAPEKSSQSINQTKAGRIWFCLLV